MAQKKKDNVTFIFDDPAVKKPGVEITIDCPGCNSTSALVLYQTQQPFYDEDSDEPVDVSYYLLVQCKGKRCDLIGIVEQTGRDSFARVFPEQQSS